MFNGIIFNKGIVNKIKTSTKGVNIFIKSNLNVKKKRLRCFDMLRWCLFNNGIPQE